MRVAIGCDRTQSAFASKISSVAAIKRISQIVNTIVRPFGKGELTDGAVTDRPVTAVMRQFIGAVGLGARNGSRLRALSPRLNFKW